MTARAQCWEHANACCREWCDQCRAEVRADDALESAIALASSDDAAASYRARVEAEALEAVADALEARGLTTRHHTALGECLTESGSAWCDAARTLRAEAAKRRAGAR